MKKILVLGATGYIGGMLVPRLLRSGYFVRCFVRDPRKLSGTNWKNVEIVQGNIFDADTLSEAFRDIDAAYYLVHSMSAGEGDFEERDRIAAENVVRAASGAAVERLIYLGGLGRRDSVSSAHLRSRHEVGEIMRRGKYSVTEFRAAVVVGAGSASFEMIHHLVNRLPIMICPRWVNVKTQPIGIEDVLRYLLECLEIPETSGRVLDIGGPDILTYEQMMLVVAKVLGLRRLILNVPVLTPRLSSYWVNLVTPIPTPLARALIESLRYETVCENNDAQSLFSFQPENFETSVRHALEKVRSHDLETKWTSASSHVLQPDVDSSHLKEDRRTADVSAPAQILFETISSLGGENGWMYADWLWKLRGFIDQWLGGIGLRRGRRHPTELAVGEALDFWRVEEHIPGVKILLRAEMKVWGRAWLEFVVEARGPESSRLIQTAKYYPKGLIGVLYWYGIYPLHGMVFRGMARSIARNSEKKWTKQKKIAESQTN